VNNIEWLNGNSNRSYPFMEDSNLVADNGITLPNSVITDLSIIIPNLSGQLPWLQSIDVSASSVSGVIYVGGTEAASFSGSLTDTFTKLTVVGTGDFSSARGVIVTGDPSLFTKEFTGSLSFEQDAATFVPRGTYEVPTGIVEGIQVVNNGIINEATFTGTVRLIAGTNVTLTEIPATTASTTDPITGEAVTEVVSPRGIRIDVAGGEFTEECECEEGAALPLPIRSINGVTGDAFGNVNIISATDCIQIDASGGSVTIEDTCSTPCCGCEELDFINSKLEEYRATVKALESRALALESADIAFRNNVLASI